MKKITAVAFSLFLCAGLLLAGCSQKEAFELIPIDVEELETMVQEKEDFVLIVERDNCPFCDAMNEYIESTKQEHPDVKAYVIDISALDMKKPTEEAVTLISSTSEGKRLLKILPYFYYTPTMYQFEKGQASLAGIGYNSQTNETSLWDTTSSIDFDAAKTENVWDFLEGTKEYDN